MRCGLKSRSRRDRKVGKGGQRICARVNSSLERHRSVETAVAQKASFGAHGWYGASMQHLARIY